MLEVLVFHICIMGNMNACTNAANAYYKQEHMDVKLKDFTQRHRDYFLYLNIAKVIKEGKVTIPFSRHYILDIDQNKNGTAISYRYSF